MVRQMPSITYSQETKGVPLTASLLAFSYFFLYNWDPIFLLSFKFPVSPSFFVFGLGLLVTFVTLLRGRRIAVSASYVWLAIITLPIYLTMSLFWTENYVEGLRLINFLWVQVLLISGMYALVAVTGINRRVPVLGYLWGAVSAGVFGMITYGFGFSGRFTIAPGYNPTWYAVSASTGIIIIAAVVGTGSKKSPLSPLLLILGGVFLFVTLVLTQGRNSLLALILASAVCGLYYMVFEKKSIIKKLKTFGFAFFLCSSLVVFGAFVINKFPDVVNLTRLQTLFDANANSSQVTAGRTEVWQHYLDLMKETNLLLGKGIGSTRNVIIPTVPGISSPHNSYLMVMYEAGVVGLSLWLFLQGGMIYFAAKKAKRATVAILGMAVFMIAIGFGNDTVYYKYFWTQVPVLLFIGGLTFFAGSSLNQRKV